MKLKFRYFQDNEARYVDFDKMFPNINFQQFVGTDINGREFYEGDLVQSGCGKCLTAAMFPVPNEQTAKLIKEVSHLKVENGKYSGRRVWDDAEIVGMLTRYGADGTLTYINGQLVVDKTVKPVAGAQSDNFKNQNNTED